MSIITRYSNQTVSLERYTGENEWHEATYEDPVDISVRYEQKSGLTRTATGDQTQVESYILTETEIKVADLIEGSEVIRVEAKVPKNGITMGYEVYL